MYYECEFDDNECNNATAGVCFKREQEKFLWRFTIHSIKVREIKIQSKLIPNASETRRYISKQNEAKQKQGDAKELLLPKSD